MTNLIVSIMVYFMLAIAAVWGIVENFNKYNKTKRAFTIIVLIGLFIFGPWDLYNRFNETENDKQEVKTFFKKTIENLLKPLLPQSTSSRILPPVNKTLPILPKKQTLYARLDIRDGLPITPVFVKTQTPDSLMLALMVKNKGNGAAFNFKCLINFIDYRAGNYFFNKKEAKASLNPTNILYPGQESGFEYSYKFRGDIYNIKTDSLYVAILIQFSDSTKKFNYFHKIYFFNRYKNDFYDTALPEYNTIKNLLIVNKKWPSQIDK